MKLVFKPVLLALVAATVALTGCTKKPARPDPRATVLGQQPGGSGLTPTDLTLMADQNSGLVQRTDGVIEDENTIRGLLQPVYFDFNDSSIKPSERSKLQLASEYLQKNPQHRLLLEGHCDWRGTAEYNLGLGDRRATAARNYLGTIGVSNDKLETLSKGDLEATESADEAAAAKDRRVEIVVLKR